MRFMQKIKRPIKSLFLVLVGIILIAVAFYPHSSRANNNFSYNIDVNYYVAPVGPTFVKETYNIVNNSSTQYLDSIKLSTPSETTANIKVY